MLIDNMMRLKKARLDCVLSKFLHGELEVHTELLTKDDRRRLRLKDELLSELVRFMNELEILKLKYMINKKERCMKNGNELVERKFW